MKKNMIAWMMIITVLSVLSAMSAMADFTNVTWRNPLNGSTISGTIILNATSNVSTYNATYQIICPDNVNRTINTINITGNLTIGSAGGDAQYTTRFNTVSVEDSTICEMNVFLNATNSGDYNASVFVTVDNQVPTALTLPENGRRFSTTRTGMVSFNATVNQTSTIRCRITFPGPSKLEANNNISEGGGACNFNYSSVPNGAYDFIIYATDNSNETQSQLGQILIDAQGGSTLVKMAYIQQATAIAQNGGTGGQKKIPTVLWVAILGVVAFGAYSMRKK